MLGVLAAVSISLFAEGSHDEQRLREYIQEEPQADDACAHSGRDADIMLGDKFLLLFGEEYSQNGTHLLWLLILSCVPYGIIAYASA